MRNCFVAGTPQRQTDFSAGQKSYKAPGRAHGDIGGDLEDEKHDGEEEIDECRLGDVLDAGLLLDDLLDLVATLPQHETKSERDKDADEGELPAVE